MATYKILPGKDIKKVVARGSFSDKIDFDEIKKKINENLKITGKKAEKTHYKLILDDPDHKLYFPVQLKDGIGNQESLSYLKEKLQLRANSKDAYKFYAQAIDKEFKWKEPENNTILKEILKESWKSISSDIINDIDINTLEESQKVYKDLKNKLLENEKEIEEVEHNKIICNNCFDLKIKGKRFICAECKNYNLCQKCEKINYQKQIHERDHTLIQLNKALDDESEELYKYDNIIGNNNKLFKNVPIAFPIEISVVNCGENDLKGCYILPVRFGEDYLSCIPKKIDNEFPRNISIKINLVVRLPRDKGSFEGYFRMFTPSGLPFGNIVFIKVLNGD